LRGIKGFRKVLEDRAQRLATIPAATRSMGTLIGELLLSRVTGSEMHREGIDSSQMAGYVPREAQSAEPTRNHIGNELLSARDGVGALEGLFGTCADAGRGELRQPTATLQAIGQLGLRPISNEAAPVSRRT